MNTRLSLRFVTRRSNPVGTMGLQRDRHALWARDDRARKGTVYLVGAGPGDPGLITVKGAKVLSRADVILYDYLANPDLLKWTRKKAQKIFVGKKGRGHYYFSQSEITRRMTGEARGGKTVVRLKGGDPFIFGRGGEEAAALSRAKIPFEIVPGVTAATAVPASAGIPLTHRDLSSSVVFVTGHQERGGGVKQKVNWKGVARMGTIVLFMATARLKEILGKLTRYGLSPGTPAAIISWGTYPFQKTVVGRVDNLVPLAKKGGVTPPTIVVIGQVVKLHKMLKR